MNSIVSTLTDAEIRHYCINTDAEAAVSSKPSKPAVIRFPKTTSERKEFIFSRTGFTAKPMNWKGWYLFNYSMNKGLDIGLPTEGSDRTLEMLSLIDHSLAEVPRFVGISYMLPVRADSTTAHTKQVMNIIQQTFENSGVAFNGKLTPEVNQFRRDALLGAWVHDIGETIFELTTASDMFNLEPSERAKISAAKDALESELFPFFCQLAVYALEKQRPELFNEVIWNMRNKVLAPVNPPGGTLSKAEQLCALMQTVRDSMDEVKAREDFLKEMAPETIRLMDIYERAENPKKGGFLHPFVKTLECVEGLRYMQRQAAAGSTDALSKQLHTGNPSYPEFAGAELWSDHEIISTLRRSERRLPLLFERAGQKIEGEPETSTKRALANAAAKFTYNSIARQFTPRTNRPDPTQDDHVGIVSAIIDRKPTPSHRDLHAIPIAELRDLCAKDMKLKNQWSANENPSDPNRRFFSREEIGALYRAAEAQVGKCFWPKSPSLISVEDTPEIPKPLVAAMLTSTRTGRGEVVKGVFGAPPESASR
jgi:hypothetical protein